MKHLGFLLMVLLFNTKPALSTDYCKMNCGKNMHTMCKYKPGPGPNCGSSYGGKLNSTEKQEVLNLHNEYRMKIANGEQLGIPKAADMMEMVWDNELEAIAQRWADQCSFMMAHDHCRRTANFSAVGQNIARKMYSINSEVIGETVKLINLWYDEVKLFNIRDINSYRFDWEVAHFTQMGWAKTTHIGCARAQWKGRKIYQELVCNYGPSGNYISQPIYTIGLQCSKCPIGSSCSSKYTGLCTLQYY